VKHHLAFHARVSFEVDHKQTLSGWQWMLLCMVATQRWTPIKIDLGVMLRPLRIRVGGTWIWGGDPGFLNPYHG
jgi:hypothetical protein